MSVMPQARILVYADEVPDELVASHRSSIEASGTRILGEPEIPQGAERRMRHDVGRPKRVLPRDLPSRAGGVPLDRA